MIHGLVATLFAVPLSWAGNGPEAQAANPRGASCHHEATTAGADPARCATRVELMGLGNCSVSTAQMAERVLHDGAPYTFVGSLNKSENQLDSHVAAPFTVGPNADIHVIANEVLEKVAPEDVGTARLELRGKLLTVNGLQYLVVTQIGPGNS